MTLLNCFMPVFTCVLRVIQQPKRQVMEARPEVLTLLTQAQGKARLQGFTAQDIESASFALVVWADEAILCADKEDLHLWRQISLQQECYESALGGYTFFENLQTLNSDNHSVRLVYLFCLLCGLRGRYGKDENLLLDGIIEQQMVALPDALKKQLSSNDFILMPGNEIAHSSHRKRARKITLVASVCGVVLVYFLCNVWLISIIG